MYVLNVWSNKVIFNLTVVIKSEIEIQDNNGKKISEVVVEHVQSSSLAQHFEKTSLKSVQACETMKVITTSINKTRKRNAVSKEERMKNAGHIPMATDKRKRCVHCSRHFKQSRTKVMCQSCNVGLCLRVDRNCFELYHTG